MAAGDIYILESGGTDGYLLESGGTDVLELEWVDIPATTNQYLTMMGIG